jgi:hypothetical protein
MLTMAAVRGGCRWFTIWMGQAGGDCFQLKLVELVTYDSESIFSQEGIG